MEARARIEARASRLERIVFSQGQSETLLRVERMHSQTKCRYLFVWISAALFVYSASKERSLPVLRKKMAISNFRGFGADKRSIGAGWTHLMKYLWWFAVDWCCGAGVAQLRVEMWVGETREQW
jgi:hypothetical protein